MSALFKRNDKTTIAELEEYYANQKQQRSGRAWVMALLSLLITVAVIVGLFFAGRWAYRALFDSDDSDNVTASTASESSSADGEDANLPTFDSEELGERGVSFEDSSSDNQDDLVQGDLNENANSETSGGVVSDQAATTDESNQGTVSSATTSESEDTLPDTGAGETVMVILFATVVFGYLLARKHQLQ